MPTKVIILGGGVAGMSAAHELIERGFEVVVLESGDIAGGKARSIPVTHEGEDTSGYQLAEWRRGFALAPGARRAWVSVLPGFLQARDRHHAPHPVV